jgi:hypothetical protein
MLQLFHEKLATIKMKPKEHLSMYRIQLRFVLSCQFGAFYNVT